MSMPCKSDAIVDGLVNSLARDATMQDPPKSST